MILSNSKINTKVREKQENIVMFTQENIIEGSDEEKADLKRIYVDTAGDMDQIFERHLLTCLEDEDRLRSMIDQMIEDKDVPPFDAYTKETKAKRNKRHRKVC
jgi:TnpA family transposase